VQLTAGRRALGGRGQWATGGSPRVFSTTATSPPPPPPPPHSPSCLPLPSPSTTHRALVESRSPLRAPVVISSVVVFASSASPLAPQASGMCALELEFRFAKRKTGARAHPRATQYPPYLGKRVPAPDTDTHLWGCPPPLARVPAPSSQGPGRSALGVVPLPLPVAQWCAPPPAPSGLAPFLAPVPLHAVPAAVSVSWPAWAVSRRCSPCSLPCSPPLPLHLPLPPAAPAALDLDSCPLAFRGAPANACALPIMRSCFHTPLTPLLVCAVRVALPDVRRLRAHPLMLPQTRVCPWCSHVVALKQCIALRIFL
jgi:hypothetical protein